MTSLPSWTLKKNINFADLKWNFSYFPAKSRKIIMVKWKTLRIQFDVVFDFESLGGIFDSLAPFDGELWRFFNFKSVWH